MAEIQNANPTIRSASDLPSRRREIQVKTLKKPSLGLLASVIPNPAYSSDPFTTVDSSGSEKSDDEDDTYEPIDEQEIYGK